MISLLNAFYRVSPALFRAFRAAFVLLALLPLASWADGRILVAYDGKDIVSQPSAEDLRIIQEKFEKSKIAYNGGDFFWKDLEPYYFYNGLLLIERYTGLSLEKFLKLKTESEDFANGPEEFKAWIDQKNYSRIMNGYSHVNATDVSELIDYTNNTYIGINDALFAPDARVADKAQVASIRYVYQTLMKLPPVEAGARIYRCDYYPKDAERPPPVPERVKKLYAKSSEGTNITHWSFMSTTRGEFAGARVKLVDNCLYLRVIKTKPNSGGRDIIGFAFGNAYEEEVLFLPRTQLRIVSLEKKSLGRGKTQLILNMEEL